MLFLAIAFGVDDTRGDSAFYPSADTAVSAASEATFERLLADWKDLTHGETVEETVAGFWIVTKNTLERALEIWDDMDPTDDGTTYAANHAVKNRLKNKSVNIVMNPSIDDSMHPDNQ